MPLEIKELSIKISVNQPSGGKTEEKAETAGKPGGNAGQMVSECVEQVIRIINDKKER
ncbi:MAG: hypothetical protein HOP10_04165 [Chitinophagaceae bacterium]|nr:hypothetical protein [Chitinophagaceae bacterium]